MAKTAKSGSRGAASKAPVTSFRTGAGPDVSGSGGFTGEAPAIREERHGGTALTDKPAKTDTVGGGLEFERQRSGTRAEPTKEQPTTPERAEVVEGRRLEREIQQAKVNPASAAAGQVAKVGDRIRVLRNAASGWEMGTVTHLAKGGASGSAELDGGEEVGLEVGRWEPAVGALAAPTVDDRDLKEHGGTIDRKAQDAEASKQEAASPRAAPEAKTSQRSARPSRAKAGAKAAKGSGK